jgi:hypothetical protein
MVQNINKKKLIKFFIGLIRHDFGFYNPIWKWSLLPEEISVNFDLLKDKLEEWQKKGYIRIFMKDGERMIEIFSVPDE